MLTLAVIHACALATVPTGPAAPRTMFDGDQAWVVLAMIAGVALIVFSLRRRAERTIDREGEGIERLEAIRRQVGERYPRLARSSHEPSSGATSAAELEELAERLAAKLDERAARLERLIDQADRRIRVLESAAGPGADPPASRPADPLRPPVALDPIHARVRELADRGVAPVEIARSLGIPTGQVELILSLRRVPSAM